MTKFQLPPRTNALRIAMASGSGVGNLAGLPTRRITGGVHTREVVEA